MSTRMLRASPLSIAVVVIIAAVSVVGFSVSKHSADQQERALLQSDTTQAAVYVGSVFSNIGSQLDVLATAASLSGSSPATFVARAAPLAHGILALILAHDVQGSYVVDAAVGPGFSAGQTLSPTLSATLAKATSTLTPAPVAFDGRSSTAGFAVGPPLAPAGTALYMQFLINPFLASSATTAKPFAALKVAVYGAPTADGGSLLVATAHDLPLPGLTATAHATVGTATWTVVASARSPLTGGFASHAPYIILALGLFVAFLVAATVEVLDRRRRYAAQLVAARTAHLKDSLAELREAQSALVRGERLTALGEMASIVGHELRNPLAAVTNALYLLRRVLGEPADPSYEKHLAMAERETGKAAALAEDLTAFVRPRAPQKDRADLEDIVHEVVEAAPPPAAVQLSVDGTSVPVSVDRRQIAEVLTNLMINAYQAVGDGGTVQVKVQSSGSWAMVAVEDSGAGLPSELAERVFEPFFTTKHDGTGLGLAIVQRLVEGHGGEVSFEAPAAGRGARVVVRLPAEPQSAQPARLDRSAAPVKRQAQKVSS
ncbi:MAG TPA: ATP-binding protein [Acidimicrobiales bacterium]|nr:ATP-binding protein [Acidimicrobiales bacterium]